MLNVPRLKISSVVESRDESNKEGSSASKTSLTKGMPYLEHGTGAPSQQATTKVWFYVNSSKLIKVESSYTAFLLPQVDSGEVTMLALNSLCILCIWSCFILIRLICRNTFSASFMLLRIYFASFPYFLASVFLLP